MNNDQARSMTLAMMHVDALHEVCAGIEKVIDARIAVSVYIARVGQILATLRQHKLTDRDEIDQLIELLTLTAMNDKNAVAVHDTTGAPMLTPEEKAKAH